MLRQLANRSWWAYRIKYVANQAINSNLLIARRFGHVLYAVKDSLCGRNVLQSVAWLIDSAVYLLIKINLLWEMPVHEHGRTLQLRFPPPENPGSGTYVYREMQHYYSSWDVREEACWVGLTLCTYMPKQSFACIHAYPAYCNDSQNTNRQCQSRPWLSASVLWIADGSSKPLLPGYS